MEKNKPKNTKRNPKTPRNMAATHTFKKLYGQNKLAKEPVKPICKVRKDGVLERRQ